MWPNLNIIFLLIIYLRKAVFPSKFYKLIIFYYSISYFSLSNYNNNFNISTCPFADAISRKIKK